MKTEDLNQACPKCGCKDKNVSKTVIRQNAIETCYIPHFPEGRVGVIRCSECGYIFEVCKNEKIAPEVKKLQI